MRDSRDDFAKQCRAELEATAALLEQQIADAQSLVIRCSEHLAKVRQHLAQLDRQTQREADENI